MTVHLKESPPWTWANREVHEGDVLLQMPDGTPLLAEDIGHDRYQVCDAEGPLSMQALTHHLVTMTVAYWRQR